SQAFVYNQMISDDFSRTAEAPAAFTEYVGQDAQRVDRIWLAAAKTTDSIYLAPMTIPRGLSTERVWSPRTLKDLVGDQVLDALAKTSVRAAALSATFILVNRAALGKPAPAKGTPLVASLMASCLRDIDKYPLNDFLRGDHDRTCEQACYR